MFKKNIYLSFLILFLIFILTLSYSISIQKSLSNKVLRLHILANSNSTFDQELKLKVRDEIINYLTPKLENSKNLSETKEIISNNLSHLQLLSQNIVSNYSDYKTSVSLDTSIFPTKHYGNISFPAGDYQALKIVIGEGKGNNWWCVMFPPLCFTNSSSGVFDSTSELKLKENLSSTEYALIKSSNKPNVKIKFKLLEWWNS